MENILSHDAALALLKKYNKEPFHIQHGLTVEGVMRWFAEKQGEDADYWGIIGLLHDIDFELYPEEHCKKAPELLQEAGVPETMIHPSVPMAMAYAPISSQSTSWKKFYSPLMN